MNNQELILDLHRVIREKNDVIMSLIENSKSQSITNKVLLKKLRKQQIELDNIKSVNLN